MGAYSAPNQFAAGQGDLASVLRGYATGGIGGDAYGGDTRALIDALGRQVSGKDSLAREQVRGDLASAMANLRGMAATARPGQGPLAWRTAMQQAGALQSGAAQQGAMAGLAERIAATGALGGILGQARQTDLQRALGERQLQIGAGGALEQLLRGARGQDLESLAAQGALYGQIGGQELQQGALNQEALNRFALRRPELELQNREQDDRRLLEALQQRAGLAELGQRGTSAYEQERTRRLTALQGQPQGPSDLDRALQVLLGIIGTA